MTPKQVLAYAKEKGAKQIDLRFTDLPGLSQHVSYPITQLDEDAFEEGFGFDGSSIRGWAAINESDMLLVPDPGPATVHTSWPMRRAAASCSSDNAIDRHCLEFQRSPEVRRHSRARAGTPFADPIVTH